jgi:multisubunit Na+/H+ antiporter MnhE subunit
VFSAFFCFWAFLSGQILLGRSEVSQILGFAWVRIMRREYKSDYFWGLSKIFGFYFRDYLCEYGIKHNGFVYD